MGSKVPAGVCRRDTSRGGVGVSGVSDSSGVASIGDGAGWLTGRSSTWMRTYVRLMVTADFSVAVVAAIAAAGLRFGAHPNDRYLALSLALPLLWIIALRVFGAYERRFVGTGSDEFRR